jgi:hypothetical protein
MKSFIPAVIIVAGLFLHAEDLRGVYYYFSNGDSYWRILNCSLKRSKKLVLGF